MRLSSQGFCFTGRWGGDFAAMVADGPLPQIGAGPHLIVGVDVLRVSDASRTSFTRKAGYDIIVITVNFCRNSRQVFGGIRMKKDRPNFQSLSEEEREEIIKNKKYWEDSPPGIKEFAESIFNDIKNKELPYVMSIEGGFGTGKTHFVTRFFAHMEGQGEKVVYLDAGKYDYLQPLLCITKQMYQCLGKDGNFKDRAMKLLGALSISLPIPGVDVNVNIGSFLKIPMKTQYGNSKNT
jgi:hypothetical protein